MRIRDLASLGVAIALGMFVSLVACGEIKDLGGDALEVTVCPFASCGTVFLCTGGRLPMPSELCWMDDDANELAAAIGADVSCVPTPRGGALGWPCIYSCEPHRGCNAYDGCFCGGR